MKEKWFENSRLMEDTIISIVRVPNTSINWQKIPGYYKKNLQNLRSRLISVGDIFNIL